MTAVDPTTLVTGGNVHVRKAPVAFVAKPARARLGGALMVAGAIVAIINTIVLALAFRASSHISATATSFTYHNDAQAFIYALLPIGAFATLVLDIGYGMCRPSSILTNNTLKVLTALLGVMVTLIAGIAFGYVGQPTLESWGAAHGISNLSLPENTDHVKATLSVLNDDKKPAKVTFDILDSRNFTVTLGAGKVGP